MKDGHLDLGFDTALQAVDLSAVSDSDLDSLVVSAEAIASAGLHTAMPAAADAYFRAHRFEASAGPVAVDAGFAVVVVLEGTGVLTTADGSSEVARGDVVLVPFAAGDYTLHGLGAESLIGVVCRPPAPDAPRDPR
jgi:mannose-6-phosphate isomerase